MTSTIASKVLALSSQVSAFAPQKMISYNIRLDTPSDRGVRDWQQRKAHVIKFLKDEQASVIGLQEVRNNQLVDIERELTSYGRVGVGRDDGVTGGEYSPIFYDEAVWKLDEKEHGTFWLSDTPEVPGSRGWGNRTTRICSWVRLMDEAGKGIYIFNTHWDHLSWRSREKSAAAIMDRIKGRANMDEPYVLMGDLNTKTVRAALKILLKDGFLVDPSIHQVKTYNSWKAGIKRGRRIDHIFVSPELENVAVDVVATGDPPASDHHPLVLTIDGGGGEDRDASKPAK